MCGNPGPSGGRARRKCRPSSRTTDTGRSRRGMLGVRMRGSRAHAPIPVRALLAHVRGPVRRRPLPGGRGVGGAPPGGRAQPYKSAALRRLSQPARWPTAGRGRAQTARGPGGAARAGSPAPAAPSRPRELPAPSLGVLRRPSQGEVPEAPALGAPSAAPRGSGDRVSPS